MTGSTPLREIKTTLQLTMLLASEGWKKTPTNEPICLEPMTWQGERPIAGPCWENSCEAWDKKTGHPQITLHPGLGEDHGDVCVIAEITDGMIKSWCMCESYSGSSVDLDPQSICLDELRDRLGIWIAGWGEWDHRILGGQ